MHADQHDRYGSKVVVEHTENTLVNGTQYLQERLKIRQDAGLELALDGFGTGCTSLTLLKRFNIQYLKVAPAFLHTGASSTERDIFETTS